MGWMGQGQVKSSLGFCGCPTTRGLPHIPGTGNPQSGVMLGHVQAPQIPASPGFFPVSQERGIKGWTAVPGLGMWSSGFP